MQPWPANTECPDPSFQKLKQTLNLASFHFADDSGAEWERAYKLIDEAVDIVILNKYPFWALKRMFNEIKPLYDLDSFVDRMLKKLYAERR